MSCHAYHACLKSSSLMEQLAQFKIELHDRWPGAPGVGEKRRMRVIVGDQVIRLIRYHLNSVLIGSNWGYRDHVYLN